LNNGGQNERALSAILFVGLIYSASFSFSDTSDTLGRIKDCDSLQKQLNAINAKLDKYYLKFQIMGFKLLEKRIENVGRGWTVGADLTTEMTGLEGGYTFKTQMEPSMEHILGFKEELGEILPIHLVI